MRADQLIGKLALREKPTRGDKSYMTDPVRIIRVENDRVYYMPAWLDGSSRRPNSYRGWLDGWKPFYLDGTRKVSLSCGSIRLEIEGICVEDAVDEIQALGDFDIITAGDMRVFADKFYGDSNEAVRKIKELVKLGWVWE